VAAARWIDSATMAGVETVVLVVTFVLIAVLAARAAVGLARGRG
jgi:hypothetical protein